MRPSEHRTALVATGLLLLGAAACGRNDMVIPAVDGSSGSGSDSGSSGETGLDSSSTSLDSTTTVPTTFTSGSSDTTIGPGTATDTTTTVGPTTDTDTDTDSSTGDPECGNGIVELGEQCDPGEELIGPNEACVPGCVLNVCGDGMQGPAEECDDANADDEDACHVDCTATGVVQIAAGGNHNCVLVDNGSVRCWGNGNNGRTGYGNEDNIGDDEPAGAAGVLSLGGPVEEITAGIGHTCARDAVGSVRCFGRAAEGQLGYASILDIGDDELPGTEPFVMLGGAVDALASGSGSFHGCALLGSAMRCWGASGNGRLGVPGLMGNVGDDEPASAAMLVDLGGVDVEAMSTGAEHSCALLIDGSVRCWGGNASGQLGLGMPGDIGDDEEPAAVPPINVGGSAIQIAAGWFHTCVLLDTGQVRCWGRGNNGRLGYGNTTWLGLTTTPADHATIDVGGVVVQIVAGNAHTCALLDSGAVRCWGWGGQGQLGYGNTNDIGDDELPSAAGDVDVGGSVLQLAAGGNHSCALMASGQVRCWGNGGDGRLGYGSLATIGDDETPASAGDVPLF